MRWIPAANVFYSPQYSSLYTLRTLTNAAYNAMEVTLQHKMTHGLQFDFNYNYSKSIDISSDAERVGASGGLGGQIVNAWNPASNRGPSDFDLRHQINANGIWLMPFGRGQAWGHDMNRALDALVGGWQLSDLFRLTCGFPVNVDNAGQYPTNYQLEGNANRLMPVTTGVYFTGAGNGPNGTSVNTAPNVFPQGPAAINSFGYAFPGQTGARNQLRGLGFFGIDLGLAKRWKMPWAESQSLQFRWEVFNVTNSVRFDVQSAAASNRNGALFNGNGQTFGNYTRLITNPRLMQFALRYEF